MHVKHLSLVDFRNYSTAEVELRPAANLFVGSNGQGKTNLVEALGYLSTLGSHRVSTDQALIRHGAESAVIRARLGHGERELLAEVQLNRSGANRAQVNRASIRPRELPRYFSSVLFAPEDLVLVRGEPSGRRRFLDELLVLLAPRISSVLADYDRVLRQRNTLLKSARASRVPADKLTTLDIWDERLVQLGSELIEARSILISRLAPEVAEAYAAVAGQSHAATLGARLSILDDSGAGDGGAGEVAAGGTDADDSAPAQVGAEISAETAAGLFREALLRRRSAEIERAITLVGPHRDDLVLGLNGLPARGYASHGESWSFALALKLASARLLRQDSASGDPVLVLDDVFAELDRARRTRLADAVGGFEQVLITAAVFEDVPSEFTANTVRIEAGRIAGSS